MAEYWYFKDGVEQKARSFLSNQPEAVVKLKFSIGRQDFVNAGTAAAAIKLSLKRIGVDYAILRSVAIAAYEAEINCTAHANGADIFCNVYPDMVHIVFHDFGPGMKDIEQSMVPGFSTADKIVREMGFGAGLGLPNIKKNTDAMHIISEYGERTYLELIMYY